MSIRNTSSRQATKYDSKMLMNWIGVSLALAVFAGIAYLELNALQILRSNPDGPVELYFIGRYLVAMVLFPSMILGLIIKKYGIYGGIGFGIATVIILFRYTRFIESEDFFFAGVLAVMLVIFGIVAGTIPSAVSTWFSRRRLDEFRTCEDIARR